MIVGIPKEIKNQEYRVGMTPAGVQALVSKGHQVLVQSQAGLGAGFSDADYRSVGAEVLVHASDVYAQADLIVKVKEPQSSEYGLIRPNQCLFTYFHFAASEELTRAMMHSGAQCLAYETVSLSDASLPLLVPMSEIAGRLAIQVGAYHLAKPMGGKGKLLGGVPGVAPAEVLILGAGIVGTQAAKMAAGLGAKVRLLDTNLQRLRYLADVMPANVQTEFSSRSTLLKALPQVDLVIGAVLLQGSKAPHLILEEDLNLMEKGTVLVDVAVDQGGCIATCHPTTHDAPTYEVNGVLHYCVANMPGSVPQTATAALTQATLPYVLRLADLGWEQACKQDPALAKGLSVAHGQVLDPRIKDLFDL